jgi:hypothetical protein
MGNYIYLSTSVLVWQGVAAVSTTAVLSTKSPTATSPTQVHAIRNWFSICWFMIHGKLHIIFVVY